MALVGLSVKNVEKLSEMSLTIPLYQRAYRWQVASIKTLFSDLREAFKTPEREYRLGSIILHKDKDENDKDRYNIVDGQQRLTSFSLLLRALDTAKLLTSACYKSESYKAIKDNYKVLAALVQGLEDKEAFITFLLTQCTFVQIVTNDEQEAFQFFDSQNSRGKALDPHDLLKAYHLRAMSHESEATKIEVVEQWEGIDPEELKVLFSTYLYRALRWYKRQSGLGYSKEHIGLFKGIQRHNLKPFALYHKAAHTFIDHYQQQRNTLSDFVPSMAIESFQLTQPIMDGKRFFLYIHHYANLLKKVKRHTRKFEENQNLPHAITGRGDEYVRNLYETVLLFSADRFGVDSLSPPILWCLYSWAYSLRFELKQVQQRSVDNYAIGVHGRINKGSSMLYHISEMTDIEDLLNIPLAKVGEGSLGKHSERRICYNEVAKNQGWSK